MLLTARAHDLEDDGSELIYLRLYFLVRSWISPIIHPLIPYYIIDFFLFYEFFAH